MAPPLKERNLDGMNGAHSNGDDTFDLDPLTPATAEDKANWTGFCEIESNPAFFNVMLKDFGVKGVKVQEVYGLDDAALSYLPKPIHGLIFLYRYRADDETEQEAICPDNVWFANQVSDFSCATVSLLNIINNIPNAELGPQLQDFKDFTQSFPPATRGDSIANFQFVKTIHNSFARKMDMLNTDLGLQNQYDDRNKPKKAAAKPRPKTPAKKGARGPKKTSKVITEDDYQNENGFHFSAYVPVEGKIWKLDGLDRQPRKVGEYDDDLHWMHVITPVIEEQMTMFAAGDLEFSLLGVVADPVDNARKELARNIKSIRSLHSRLDEVNPEWKSFLTEQTGAGDADAICDTTDEMIDAAEAQSEAEEAPTESCPEKLSRVRDQLIKEQQGIRATVFTAMDSSADEEREAHDRRHDYGPVIRTWLTMLAEKEGLVRDLIDEIR